MKHVKRVKHAIWVTALAILAIVVSAARSANAQTAPEDGAGCESVPDTVRSRTCRRTFAWIEGGYELQRMYEVPAAAVEAAVGFGMDEGWWDMGATLDVARGATDFGLSTTNVNAGYVVSLRMHRLRLGGGPRVGWFGVQRFTTGDSMAALGAGLLVRISLDLLQFDEGRRAVYVVGKASGDYDGSILYQASVGLGVSF